MNSVANFPSATNARNPNDANMAFPTSNMARPIAATPTEAARASMLSVSPDNIVRSLS